MTKTKLSVTLDDATHQTFEKLKELYGITHKALSLVTVKQLERYTTLDPSPKLKKAIRDYVLTNNPIYILQAEDEFSRLFEYDMYYEKTLSYDSGTIPFYRDATQYKRRTGLDDWDAYSKRMDKCSKWEWLSEIYPEFHEMYPTFFHWEKKGCPEFDEGEE